MKYLCTSQNAYLCRCAIANFPWSAFICLFFSDSFGHVKSLSRECKWLPLWGTTMASENRYRFFKCCGKWFLWTIVVTLQLLALPWFLRSKFLYWNKAPYKCVSLIYIVFFNHSPSLKCHIPQNLTKISMLFFFCWSLGVERINGDCVCVQGSAWPTSDRSSHQEWNRQPKVPLFSYYSMSFTSKKT